MQIPRAAVLHDLSGYGRCSLSVAMPILSVMGVQCCPLPTAFLSAHTGFAGSTFLDMTEDMKKAAAHWKEMQLSFDAIYSGFVASQAQIDVLKEFITQFRRPNATLVLIDPVMGDHGAVYRTYTPAMCRSMADLCTLADIITPNLTEACLILDEPYENRPKTKEELRVFLQRLSMGGARSVVLTGISFSDCEIGAGYFCRETGETAFAFHQKVQEQFPGAGDVFSSVVLGALLSGIALGNAAQMAVDFVADCGALTLTLGADPLDGLLFEPFLSRLHPWDGSK